MKKIKKNTFLQDFQAFINRGNVVDMAVGVIIGGAFSKIVSSLVSDIIMPLLSLLTGKATINEMHAILREAPADGSAEAVTLNYGMFLQYILDFLLVALTIFIVIRMIGKMRAKLERKKEEVPPAPEAPPEPSKEEVLLTEIRDLLKEK